MSYHENLISDQIDGGIYEQEQHFKFLDSINMINRITTEPILTLQDNEIAVVGTNEGGRHKKGFALYCFENFGAIYGQGFGLQGRCFGIPTKNNTRPLETLPIPKIAPYVDKFIDFAESRQDLIFKVSKVGCGLAGYTVEDIAPLFKKAIYIRNIHLPQEFWDELIKHSSEPPKDSDIEWAERMLGLYNDNRKNIGLKTKTIHKTLK